MAVDDPRRFLRIGMPARRRGSVVLGASIIIRWSGDRRRPLRARRAAVIVVGTGIVVRRDGDRRRRVPAGHGGWVVLGTGIFIRWRSDQRLARGGALACGAGVIFFGRGRFADGA